MKKEKKLGREVGQCRGEGRREVRGWHMDRWAGILLTSVIPTMLGWLY